MVLKQVGVWMAGKIINRISVVAAERKLEIKEIAKISGLPSQTIRRQWKDELNGISFDTLAGLCYALDCQPGDLLEFISDNGNTED
jgi:putative transcriptional regulator